MNESILSLLIECRSEEVFRTVSGGWRENAKAAASRRTPWQEEGGASEERSLRL
jgi:hypothetical protein